MNDMKDITAAITACKGADFELQPLKIRLPQGDEVLVRPEDIDRSANVLLQKEDLQVAMLATKYSKKDVPPC